MYRTIEEVMVTIEGKEKKEPASPRKNTVMIAWRICRRVIFFLEHLELAAEIWDPEV